MKRQVVIHTAGGGPLGFGHIRRSVSIARHLVSQHGARVVLSVNDHPQARDQADASGLPVVVDAGEAAGDAALNALAARCSGAVLFLDRPRAYSGAFVRQLRSTGPVLLFHNTAAGMWDATCCLFPMAHLADDIINDARWSCGRARLLHGPEYVVMGDDVVAAAVAARSRPRLPHVAVIAGASDPHDILSRVPPWLVARGGMPVTAYYGADYPDVPGLKALAAGSGGRWVCTPFTHAAVFQSSMAVSAFGVTVYELIYAGVPTVTIGLTPPNGDGALRLEQRHGCVRYAGLASDLSRSSLSERVGSLWDDQEAMARMRQHQLGLLDGRGLERVAGVIMELAEGDA